MADPNEYVKVRPKAYPVRDLRETAEGRYWKSYSLSASVKQIGSITHVDYAPQKPHYLAVTASTRIVIYDTNLNIKRSITRFKDKAYCGTFRSDGRLIAAGGEDSIVQLFDANSRSLLRQFKGHTRPVHVVQFSNDKNHLLSGADDAIIRTWDVASGDLSSRHTGHSDYIRALAVSQQSADIFASGSYDHTIKVWDNRTSTASHSMQHGAPVESLAFLPSESILLSAGGPYLCIWDLYSGGRLLHKFTASQKTLTKVVVERLHTSIAGGWNNSKVVDDSMSAPLRIITSSLDGHVKVFDPETFQLTHSTKYSSPVTSIAFGNGVASSLAVGMADGILTVRKRVQKNALSLENLSKRRQSHYAPKLTAASFRYFIRGQSTKASDKDYVVEQGKKVKLAPYDKLLRRFRYKEALDAALLTRRAEVVAAVIEDLTSRGALAAALGARDEENLGVLIDYMSKYVSDPRHTQMLCAMGHRILDSYEIPLRGGSGSSVRGGGAACGGRQQEEGQLVHKVGVLAERVDAEIKCCNEMFALKGILEAILSTGSG